MVLLHESVWDAYGEKEKTITWLFYLGYPTADDPAHVPKHHPRVLYREEKKKRKEPSQSLITQQHFRCRLHAH